MQWKNATAEAVRVALLRQRCHAITAGQPPYRHVGDDARQVARTLARTRRTPVGRRQRTPALPRAFHCAAHGIPLAASPLSAVQ